MATYPSEVYDPRTKNNKPGTVYAPEEDTALFAEDVVKVDEEIVAIETELGANPKGTFASVAAFLLALKHIIDRVDSPTIITGGVISVGTNAGTFKVTALTAYLRETHSIIGVLKYVTLAEQDNQAITLADTTYYIILNYNEGNPTISISESVPNQTQNIPIGQVMKDGSDNIHFISGGFSFQDGVSKLHDRAKTLRKLELDGGSAIAYSGTNNFTMTEGIVYGGINKFLLVAYNSAVTQFNPVYSDGEAGWTYGAKSNVIDFEHYDDGSGTLADVGVAKYGVFWIYRHVDDGDVYVRYGEGSYSLANAEAAQEPTKPDQLTDFGLLIGKIVVPQAGGSITLVQMVTDTFFVGTAVSNHAELSNLQGGAVGEYNHLTDAEKTKVTNIDSLGLTLTATPIDNSTYSGITETGVAGATLIFGDLCYFDVDDSRWEKVDANVADGYDKKLGICVLAAAADASATKMLLIGKIRADTPFPTLTIGAPVYISETAGEIVVAQPTTADVCIRIIGFANTANELFFNPSNDYIVHV